MAAGAEHVNMAFVYMDGNLAECLHSVRMEQDSMLMGNLSDFPDRLYSSNLIVGIHDGDQNRRRPDGGF